MFVFRKSQWKSPGGKSLLNFIYFPEVCCSSGGSFKLCLRMRVIHFIK